MRLTDKVKRLLFASTVVRIVYVLLLPLDLMAWILVTRYLFTSVSTSR